METGWDGANLAVYLDSQLLETYEITFGSVADLKCAFLKLGTLKPEYSGGAWDPENSYQLYSPIENDLLFSDGPNPVDGLAFSYEVDFGAYEDPACTMRTMVVSGSDCNDSDPTIGGSDPTKTVLQNAPETVTTAIPHSTTWTAMEMATAAVTVTAMTAIP